MNIAEHDAATAGYRVLHWDIQRPQNWFLLTTGTGGGCHSPDILKAVDWCFPVYCIQFGIIRGSRPARYRRKTVDQPCGGWIPFPWWGIIFQYDTPSRERARVVCRVRCFWSSYSVSVQYVQTCWYEDVSELRSTGGVMPWLHWKSWQEETESMFFFRGKSSASHRSIVSTPLLAKIQILGHRREGRWQKEESLIQVWNDIHELPRYSARA